VLGRGGIDIHAADRIFHQMSGLRCGRVTMSGMTAVGVPMGCMDVSCMIMASRLGAAAAAGFGLMVVMIMRRHALALPICS